MLGDDDLRLSTIVREAIFTLQNTIIFWAMQKDHHISILLDGTRLTEIRQLRTLTLYPFT